MTLCLGIRKAFYELTAHYYNYMVPCDRNTSHCNAKRRANGGRNTPPGKQSHPSILSYPDGGWLMMVGLDCYPQLIHERSSTFSSQIRVRLFLMLVSG